MKDIIYHTVRTVSNSNRKIVGKIDTLNIYMTAHFLAWYRHLKKSCRVILVLWAQTSYLIEMMQSYLKR